MLSKTLQWLLFLSVCACVFDDADGLTIHIAPDRIRIKQDVDSWVSILCKTDSSLAGCQFSWYSEDGTIGPLIDMTLGNKVKANRSLTNAALLDYHYFGKGLEQGECGLKMKLKGKKLWTVGCRARGSKGGWKYAWLDLIAYATDPLSNVVSDQRTVVVLPGQDLNLMCSTTQSVDKCMFSVPSREGWLDFAKGLVSKDSKGRHVSRGTGPAAGQCGLTLYNVTEQDNGLFCCYIWRMPKYADNRMTHVLVAKAPISPRLEVINEGNRLTVTCSVAESRPVVEIRWMFGEEVVRNDEVNDAYATQEDMWSWPWSPVGFSQNYTRQLVAADYGKTIKCLVSHVSLQYPIELSQLVAKSAINEKPQVTNAVVPPSIRTGDGATSSGRTRDSDCDMATSCPQRAEYCSLRLQEARYATSAASLAEQANKVTLEAARAALRAEESRAKAEEARAREEEAWRKNADEELRLDQERRNKTLAELQSTTSRKQ